MPCMALPFAAPERRPAPGGRRVANAGRMETSLFFWRVAVFSGCVVKNAASGASPSRPRRTAVRSGRRRKPPHVRICGGREDQQGRYPSPRCVLASPKASHFSARPMRSWAAVVRDDVLSMSCSIRNPVARCLRRAGNLGRATGRRWPTTGCRACRQWPFTNLAMSLRVDGPFTNAHFHRAIKITFLISIARFLCQTAGHENAPDLDTFVRTRPRRFP
jgi:hypothetical protein